MMEKYDVTIAEMQGEVDRWITEIGKGYFPPLANMAILTEEIGELARVIVRRFGPQTSKASDLDRNLEEELADVLWVVVCLANQTGVDLTEAFRKTLEKKTNRDRDRFQRPEIRIQRPEYRDQRPDGGINTD